MKKILILKNIFFTKKHFFSSHDSFKVTHDTVKAVLSPDCAYACAGGSDGSLFVWNTLNGKVEKVLNKEHS